MIFTKLKLSEDATSKLETLKRRTGLTPNILCRIALCISIDKDGIPSANTNSNGQEINRFTLNGEYDTLFIALVKQRCIEDKLDPENDFNKQYKLHTERGVDLIYNRLKYIGDLSFLIKN